MSSSIVFTGSGFYVVSAQQQMPGTVRVHFSAQPQAIVSTNPSDALNPSNYSLAGPGPYMISAVTPVLGNVLAYDIILTGPLVQGNWTLTVVNVKTLANVGLISPSAATFFVSTSQTGSLTAGATQDTSESIIRKHLNPSLKGDGWNALIAGLSKGDDEVWSFAQSAYDQLFISTASGSYLEKRASDIGLSKPAGVGINEEVFRKFAIKNNANKVVQEALREILEAFYGVDSLRAYAETELDEPYNMSGSPVLEWTLDENQTFSYSFTSTKFASSTKARAIEVAVQLTKYMHDLGSTGFALATQNPQTGGYRVRIYSASLGLRSSVRITGGDAQNVLRFPTYVEVYSSSVTGAGYTWNVSNPDQDTTKLTLTTPGLGFVNLTPVNVGDYVIIGTQAQIGVTGTYTIKDVSITYSGTNLIQSFSIQSVMTTGSGLQTANDGYRFFRPTRTTTNAGSRTVVVSQSVDGRVDISIPATTMAVTRGPKTAFYGNLNDSEEIISLTRSDRGLVSVTTATAHGLDVNDQVIFEGIQPTPYRPFVYSSPLPASTFSQWRNPQTMSASNSDAIVTPTPRPSFTFSVAPAISRIGKLNSWLAVGGMPPPGQTGIALRINDLGAGLPLITGSEADGQTQKTFSLDQANPGLDFYGLQATPFGDDKVLITGAGTLIGPGSGYTNAVTIYDGTNDTATDGGSVTYSRQGHQQVYLEDLGTVVVIGGAITPGTATNTAERAYVGNGTFGGFTSANNNNFMSVPRCDFKALPISKTQIMVIGGRMLGRESPFNSAAMLAQWKFNDVNGSTTLADEGAQYPLTLFAGPTYTINGKINAAWDFTPPGAGATSPGNTNAQDVLTNEWTICWWHNQATPAPGTWLSYGGTGVDTDPDQNVLVKFSTDGQYFTWMWENGAGIDVTGTTTRPISLNSNGEWTHYAVRKRLNPDGSTFDVDVFVNGVLLGQFPQQQNCDGGNLAAWFLAQDCELPTGPTNGMPGVFDQLTVFSKAINSAGIVAEWERGSGMYKTFQTGGNGYLLDAAQPQYGEITNRVDIYDAATDLWTEIAPMNMCRAFHEAVLLDDGRVLVMGGAGKEPTQFPDVFGGETLPPAVDNLLYPGNLTVIPNLGISPNKALRECEIYDPGSGTWQFTSSMGIPRKGLAVRKDGDEVTIFGGTNFNQAKGSSNFGRLGLSYPATRNSEIFDLKTLSWRLSPAKSLLVGDTNQIYDEDAGYGSETTRIVPLDSGITFIIRDNGGLNDFRYTPGNFQNTGTQPHEVYIPASSVVSSGGLNGQFRVKSVISTTQFTIETVERAEDIYSMNVRGGDNGFYREYGNPIHVRTLTRAGGVVTATVSNIANQFIGPGVGIVTQTLANPTGNLSVGDLVQLNVSQSTNFPSGRKIITSIPSTTTFTYAEGGGNSTETVEAGVSILRTSPGVVPVGAIANGANDPGPYLFDADVGLSITDTEGSLYDVELFKNHQYGEVEVTVTQGVFPDSGYIIFQFGYNDQSKPIKYTTTYASATNRVKLVVDYSYAFEFNYMAGAKVTLVNSRTSFQPQSLVGSAYITGSVAGRTAAKEATNAAIAAGIDPNITVVYPGDRGLGGEGAPIKLVQKLTDAVTVWAGDNTDEEVAAAKNGD